MKLLQAIPALPVQSISKSAAFYRDQLDFTVYVEEEGFAILSMARSIFTCGPPMMKAGANATRHLPSCRALNRLLQAPPVVASALKGRTTFIKRLNRAASCTPMGISRIPTGTPASLACPT